MKRFIEEGIFLIKYGLFLWMLLVVLCQNNRILQLEKDNRYQEARLQDCYYAFLANPHSWEAFSTPYMKKKWTAEPPKHHNYGGLIYEWKPDTDEVFSVRLPE